MRLTLTHTVVRRMDGRLTPTHDPALMFYAGRLTMGAAWCLGDLPTFFWFSWGSRMINPGPGFSCRLWRCLVGIKLHRQP